MEYTIENWKTRWPNFSPEEIYSPYCLKYLRHKLCPYTMDLLQLFRETLNAPVYVNYKGNTRRGVRSVKENSEILNYSPDSMHIAGRAFDISSPKYTSEELFRIAIDSGLWGGIGLYSTWVHVDSRLTDRIITWSK